MAYVLSKSLFNSNFCSWALDQSGKLGLFLNLKPIGIKISITANAFSFCAITSYINSSTRNCYNTKHSWESSRAGLDPFAGRTLGTASLRACSKTGFSNRTEAEKNKSPNHQSRSVYDLSNRVYRLWWSAEILKFCYVDCYFFAINIILGLPFSLLFLRVGWRVDLAVISLTLAVYLMNHAFFYISRKIQLID